MSEEQSISTARETFTMLRRAALVAAVVLPLTLAHGFIPSTVSISAVPTAMILLASLLFAWRTRRERWYWLGIVAMGVGSRVIDRQFPGWQFPHFLQWLCLIFIFVGTPLLLFRRRLLQLARLDAPTSPNHALQRTRSAVISTAPRVAELGVRRCYARSMNGHETDAVVIAPRIRPRDRLDGLLSAVVGLFQAAILFGLPALAAYLLTHSGVTAIAVFCAVYGLFFSFAVMRISISSEGIRFHRCFGSPRFLSWGRVTSIGVAPRAELILRGWLWPLFPAREMTACLSSLQHYRITWDGGMCYYPPAEPSLFEQHVSAKFKTRNA